MNNKTLVGVIGGILIALTAFLDGNTITFSGDKIKDTTSLVLFASGLAVIIFSLMTNRIATGYAAMVGFTLALISVVDMMRSNDIEFTAQLVVLIVGVILALSASSVGRRA